MAIIFFADSFSCSNSIREMISPENTPVSLAKLAVFGAFTIPLGFLIGSVSIGLLHIFSFCMGYFRCTENWWSYEAAITKEACKKIWPKVILAEESEFDFSKRFYMSATFDHEILSDKMNKWTMRRWNAFNTNFNCLIAIPLALLCCRWILEIKINPPVSIVLLFIAMPLAINAATTWWQTMRMIEFQATRSLEKHKRSEEKECTGTGS